MELLSAWAWADAVAAQGGANMFKTPCASVLEDNDIVCMKVEAAAGQYVLWE